MEAGLEFVNLTTSSLNEAVERGFWVNRSLGLILGATLTLDHRNGDLFIAFLALYVNASGRAFWKLVRCLLHFKGSSRAKPDGIYLQRQATLRNSNLALDAVVQFLDIWRVWRKKIRRAYRRTLDAALIALFVALTVIVAGMYEDAVFRGDILTIHQVYSHPAYVEIQTRFSLLATAPLATSNLKEILSSTLMTWLYKNTLPLF